MKKVGITILVLLLLVTVGVFGYFQYLLSELDEKYPPISFEKAQKTALERSSTDIATLSDRVDFILAAPINKLIDVAGLQADKPLPINETSSVSFSDVKVSVADQAIRVNAAFTINSSSPDVVATGQLSLVALPALGRRPDQSFAVSIQAAEPEIRFESLRVWSLTSPQVVLALVGAAARRGASHLATKLSGEHKIIAAEMPRHSFTTKIGGVEKTVPIPGLKVVAGTLLANNDEIIVLVRTQIESENLQPPTPYVVANFNSFKLSVEKLITQYFSDVPRPIKNPVSGVSTAFMSQFLREVPGETAESIVASARKAAISTLRSNDRFDVGVFVPADLVLSTLSSELKGRQAGLSVGDPLRDLKFDIELVPQAIRIAANSSAIRINDNASLRGAVTALLVPYGTQNGIEIRAAFTDFSVSSAWIDGWGVSSTTIELLTSGASAVVGEKLNAIIPPYPIAIPPIVPEPSRLAASSGPVSVSYENEAIKLRPIQGVLSTILLDANGLRVGFRIPGFSPSISAGSSELATATDDVTGEQLAQQFAVKWTGSFGNTDSQTSAYASRTFLAEYINSVFSDNSIVATIAAKQSEPIKPTTAKLGNIDADFACSRRSCTRESCALRSCTYNNSDCGRRVSCARSPGECEANCRREISYPCGGTLFDPVRTCKAVIDDPGCLARKTACNAAAELRVGRCNVAEEARIGLCTTRANADFGRCQADANVAKGACDTREEAQKLACDASAEAEVAACNIRKEAARGLNSLGEIGRIAGDTSVDATGKLKLDQLSIDPDFAKLTGSIGTNVSGEARANVSFTPSIGATLIACAPQNLRPRMKLAIDQAIRVQGRVSMTERAEEKSLQLSLAFDPLRFGGVIRPSPLDALFINNPEFLLTCPVVGNAALLANLIGKSVKVFSGSDMKSAVVKIRADLGDGSFMDIDLANGGVSSEVTLPPVEFTIKGYSFDLGKEKIELRPVAGDRAIAFKRL